MGQAWREALSFQGFKTQKWLQNDYFRGVMYVKHSVIQETPNKLIFQAFRKAARKRK